MKEGERGRNEEYRGELETRRNARKTGIRGVITCYLCM